MSLYEAVRDLAEELEEPVVRMALYEGELVEARHRGEDAERLGIAARLRELLKDKDTKA